MINVSKEFQLLMNQKTDFKENANITFANGESLELTERDFTISNNAITDASETNGIPLGVAVCRNIQIELMNDDDRFSTYDFFGAKIRLYLTFALSETIERVEYGTFTVLTPETYGETIIITALDDMHKADKDYNTTLAFPATIGSMLIDACTTLGISLGTTTFLNDSFVVNEKPSGITFRQLFGYIAMIAGGNARIDRTGRLRIHTYDFPNMGSIYNSVLNGGSYIPWDNPVNVDGGYFAPWDTGDSVDGGEYGDRNHFHVLGNWSNLKVDTDDVIITGVQANYYDEENKEQSVIYGADGYVLLIDNPLIAGKEQAAIELIGNVMVGGRFRQFSGDIVANPTCEFMDTVLLLDRKSNVYISFFTDINFQFFGFTSIKNSAEPTIRNSAKPYSEATKTLVKAKKLIEEEKTAREKAVEQLSKDLAESSGLYVTTEKQSDGSTIYYMHDKPTLKESMIVWKLTALAFGISTDGGKTYPYGFTVDGETITRLLYAEGIDADYITSGTIDAKKIEVINVVAKSVAAENITGETITGKNVVTPSADGRNIKLFYGGAYFYHNNAMAGGLSINFQENNPGVFLHNQGGRMVGVAVGKKSDGSDLTPAYIASPYKSIVNEFYGGAKFGTGSYTIIDDSEIESYSSSGTTLIDGAKITVAGTTASINTTIGNATFKAQLATSNYLNINGKELTSYGGTYDYSVLQGKLIKSYSGNTNYSTIEGKTIKSYAGEYDYSTLISSVLTLYKGSTDNLKITTNALTFAGNSSIKQGTTSLMEFTSNSVAVKGSNTYLGTSGGSLGFFGTTTKSTKKSVSTITSTSSATASSNATKINEIINALKDYNLI